MSGATMSLRGATALGARRLSSTSTLSPATKRLLADTGAKIPIIKGPMYPGSNPELVAAVSEAGGLGVVAGVAGYEGALRCFARRGDHEAHPSGGAIHDRP